MEMDKMGVVTTFIHNIVVYNIPLLYGTAGEIMVEKSGSLNLGVEGIMAVGAIFGYIVGCYANSLGVGILMAFLMGALCGLLFGARALDGAFFLFRGFAYIAYAHCKQASDEQSHYPFISQTHDNHWFSLSSGIRNEKASLRCRPMKFSYNYRRQRGHAAQRRH